MIYLISSIVLVNVFMLLKKFEEKQNFWRSLAIAIVTYECYLCLVAGTMTVIHIPVDIYSISIINFVSIICILVFLFKKKSFQKYYIDIPDSLFIIFFSLAILYLFIQRFTIDLKIVFETIDPGAHLKMAIGFVNKKSVSGMYIGQLINGLFMESMSSFFSRELIYKSFIIQCGINLFVAGITFWSAVQKSEKNIAMRFIVYATTLAYVLGYPYNDFLYGFVYLQMTITIICYLISLTEDYMNRPVNPHFFEFLLSAGCLSVSIGYTLFAPPVYFGILGLVAYKVYREKGLQSYSELIKNKQFVQLILNIFLIPSFLTLWIIIIMPRMTRGTFTNYGQALSLEGAIYRNLYSDFLLYIIPAIYGIILGFKKKKLNLLLILAPLFLGYHLIFFYLMMTNKVSTYYFYKLNYLLWMFVLVSFVKGMEEIYKNEKVLFTIFLSGNVILISIFSSKIEHIYQYESTNYIPFIAADNFFKVYEINELLEDQKTSQIPNELIETIGMILDMNQDKPIIFIGDAVNTLWYETITNQRFANKTRYASSDEKNADVLERFKTGEFGNYAVIQKDCEVFEKYQQYIYENLIFENEYTCVIKNSL